MKSKIAIVTVALNARQEIEKTIESVFRQDYSNYEYIIQDGGSADGTIQFAEQYKIKFAKKNIRYFIYDEKDEGIYDAMNKAVLKTDAEYVLFLNAGDYLASADALSKIFVELEGEIPDIVYGNYYYCYKNYRKQAVSLKVEKITKKMICAHQAILTKLELLKKRPYETDYKMAADYDFYIQMYLENKTFKKINIEIVYFDINGVSQKNAKLTQLERLDILHKYGYISAIKYRLRGIISSYISFKKGIIRFAPTRIRFRNYELFNSYISVK
ncbi:MAG: glycosyltransferase [Muribaculaceae bacterium]|nr:glycosyltransferase [Muribaculaceae bacterium]